MQVQRVLLAFGPALLLIVEQLTHVLPINAFFTVSQ
jgi:hypothetical protein